MIDSHAHYSFYKFDNTFRYLKYENGVYVIEEGVRNALLADLRSSGIEAFVEPAIGIDSNRILLEMYKNNKGFMYPAVGVHPTRTYAAKWSRRKELIDLSREEGVVAIGETGLDYHYPRKSQHRILQKMWFIYQLKLAHKTALPLILHIRKASKDAIRILKRYRNKLHGGVVHCFCDDLKTAESYLDLGLYIGIGGAVLQPEEKCSGLKDAVKHIPLERILIETDAPYVLPDCVDSDGNKPTKSIRNSSTVIFAVAEEIARIKEIDVETVRETADENARKLFGIGNR